MEKQLYILTGSSKGLGRALVKELLDADNTYVIGISREAVDEGDRYTHISLDLVDIDQIVARIDEIFPEGDFKSVTLINNAGWIGEIAPLGLLDPQGILNIHLINVVAPAVLMNAFASKYRGSTAQKAVVNISSGAASKAVDGWSGYCASKAALNQLSLVAQKEADLHRNGIRYIALSPGVVDTPMQDTIRSASRENFSQWRKFRDLKDEGTLSTPKATAAKVIQLLNNLDSIPGVLLDVREF
nr:SDR family NAD(P)-dependent oxidoreductase [Cytophagales bacterium]